MIKSLSIAVEAVVMHKDRFDKETLDLYRRCYSVCIEKEDFYIFINRKRHIDHGLSRIIGKDIMYLSELLCEYNLDFTLPTIALDAIPKYRYLNTISKLLTKENVQLKSVTFYKARRLSFFENDIEVTNDTIMDDVKSSLYSHYKDSESSKEPLAIIGEDIPDAIFKNIGEIITCSINGLLEVLK